MKNLIKMAKLDYYTIKSNSLSFLVFIPCTLLFLLMDTSLVAVGIELTWLLPLTLLSIFYIQEKNNLDNLYKSISLNSKEIVKGRYLFSLMYFLFAIIITFTAYCILAIFNQIDIVLIDVLLTFSSTFLGFIIFFCFQTPILFKFGYLKGKNLAMIPMVIFMFICGVILYTPNGLNFVWNLFKNYKELLTLLFPLVSIGILSVSYKMSVYCYYNRKY